MFSVYKHTCPNGKVYIGITSQLVENRWKHGKGYRNNKLFYRAICKYKWENIRHEILYENLTSQEAYDKEIELINKYKSNNAKYGYNLSNGGEINIGYHHTKEARQKMSKAKKGIIQSEHQRMINSIKHKKENLTEARYKIICEANRKNNLTRAKKVICIETNIIYESINEAQRQLNAKNIYKVLSGERKTANGYHFKYV